MKKVRKNPYKLLKIYFLVLGVILSLPFIASIGENLRTVLLVIIVLSFVSFRFRKRLIPVASRLRFPRFRRIYLTVTTLLAFVGIFTLGFLVGSISQSGYINEKASQKQNERSAQLTDVLNNYQGLSKLFYLQQQDMDIITDTSQWSTNTQELADAIQSYKREKNEILFQWGRLYELRRKAGLPSDPNLRAE